jgi:hypothetical protein
MYAAAGGAGSSVVARSVCTQPSDPDWSWLAWLPIVCAIGNRGRTVNAVNGKIGGIAGAASTYLSSRRPGGSGTPPP